MCKSKSLCLIAVAGIIVFSCKTESNNIFKTDSASVLKTDSVKIANAKEDTATISNKPKYPVDYSGTYLLTINNNRY